MPVPEWNPIDQYWMPRHNILTEGFSQMQGVNMDKILLRRRNQRIEAVEQGILKPGTCGSCRAVRYR